MSRLLIDNVKCNKKTCGKCKYREHHIDLAKFPTICKCKIFDKRLKVKITKLGFSSFYRLKECLQAEKDYFELLMEGW